MSVLLLLGTTACSLDVSFSQSAYLCEDGRGCPLGFECVQQRCINPLGGDVPDAGETPDADPVPDGTPAGDGESAHSWKDDTASDFNAGSGDHAMVQARGAVEPFAYYTGGVLERGSDTGLIADPATATWADVQGFPPTPRQAFARSAYLDWGPDTAAGVGLGRSDFTLSFEGEIYLEAGNWTFLYEEDDQGFLEIAPTGGAFMKVASGNWNNPGQGTISIAATGWYPIHWAFTDTGGNAWQRLSFKGPGVSTMTVVPRQRLRARADQLTGLLATGFTDEMGLGYCQTSIDTTAPAYVDWGNSYPVDLGINYPDYYTVRWSGQLRIDVAGAYSFRGDADDGQRFWLDGKPLLTAWENTTHNLVSPVVTLAPGWHDLVFDVTNFNHPGHARLTVETGPDLVGQQLPLDHLRPVEGRGERFEIGANTTVSNIPDQGSTQSTIVLTAPAGTTVTGVDVSYAFDHTFSQDLVFTLVAPNGATKVLRSHKAEGAVNNQTDFYTGAILVGAPVPGTWTLKVQDTQAQDTGVLREFKLSAHYAGGTGPIATTAVFQSAIDDLGPVTHIDKVAWATRLPTGAKLSLKLRSCAAADCAGEAWSAALPDPSGSVPTLTPRRYLQYRAELGSDGDAIPALESVQIDYRTSP